MAKITAEGGQVDVNLLELRYPQGCADAEVWAGSGGVGVVFAYRRHPANWQPLKVIGIHLQLHAQRQF